MTDRGYLSINLDVTGRRCLVIGGLEEAFRRAETLLRLGAAVALVSPRVLPEFAALGEKGRLEWRERRFLLADLDGMWAVWNTVKHDDELRALLLREAASRNLLLTSSDHAAESTFTMPAVHACGKLRIAISTGNACPSLSARVRDGLGGAFDAEFERYLEWVGQARKEVLATVSDPEERRRRVLALLRGFQVSASVTLPVDWVRAHDCGSK